MRHRVLLDFQTNFVRTREQHSIHGLRDSPGAVDFAGP